MCTRIQQWRTPPSPLHLHEPCTLVFDAEHHHLLARAVCACIRRRRLFANTTTFSTQAVTVYAHIRWWRLFANITSPSTQAVYARIRRWETPPPCRVRSYPTPCQHHHHLHPFKCAMCACFNRTLPQTTTPPLPPTKTSICARFGRWLPFCYHLHLFHLPKWARIAHGFICHHHPWTQGYVLVFEGEFLFLMYINNIIIIIIVIYL